MILMTLPVRVSAEAKAHNDTAMPYYLTPEQDDFNKIPALPKPFSHGDLLRLQ